jgi:hypothetical protein
MIEETYLPLETIIATDPSILATGSGMPPTCTLDGPSSLQSDLRQKPLPQSVCLPRKSLKTYPPNSFPCVKEIHRMTKPLGFCAFEGWSRNNFYFFDRDKKNSVLSV